MSLSVKVARSRSTGRGPGAGDPGIFGSIGRALSKVAGVAKSLPGPIGWAGAAVQKVFQPGETYIPPPVANVPAMTRAAALMRPVVQTTRGTMEQPFALPFGSPQLPAAQPPVMPANGIGAPSGYHVNKSDYFLKDGTFVPAGSRWVKNRRRNPLNPRAASRAIGRIESLKRATSRFSNITIRKKCKK